MLSEQRRKVGVGTGLEVFRPTTAHAYIADIFSYYSPFLKWNRADSNTADSTGHAFVSLASMLRDGYTFDEHLVNKITMLLRSLRWNLPIMYHLDDVLKVMGHTCTDPTDVFVDSLVRLLSFPHHLTVEETLTTVRHCFNQHPSAVLAIVSSKLFSRILSTPHLRDLSVLDHRGLMQDMIVILQSGLRLSSTEIVLSITSTSNTDPQTIRNAMLNEIFIPIETALVQLRSNCCFLSLSSISSGFCPLIPGMFEASAFHQPTLDFIRSSRYLVLFQYDLAESTTEKRHQNILHLISSYFEKWKADGVETARRGRAMLQVLEGVGFRDGIEQNILHSKESREGDGVIAYSYRIIKQLGMNANRQY
ncbi:hypothetical protein BLNAU_4186 [Blattamonas nauphoetae]|uniref:Uncharacterized protein n=1 Tax=Blattamonas nauphoetae TaxID=2049346 RepID=A0ABQ9YAQ8_9EUKA|nr:hypothetical protein BLNAU_4186 [Blattamonas nauphoetae]